jgi:protein gp37
MPTRIEWAEETWNPVTGCSPVSAGCEHCYAARMAKRLAGRFGYPKDDPFQVTYHPERINEPLRWRKPRMVFVCSMGDLFHEDMPNVWRREVLQVMANAQRHTFFVLTKRPGAMLRWYTKMWGRKALPNVWLGVTAESQKAADERIPLLLKTPAAKRFVSCEPLLGPVVFRAADFSDCGRGPGWLTAGNMARKPKLDWVICGAETGPGARHMHSDWARSIRDQCQEADVPFFYKKGSDGSRLLDGREWNEKPDCKEEAWG